MAMKKDNREAFVELISNIASKVARVHSVDADWVRPGAEHHGVNVIESDLFGGFSLGDYNPHIPTGSKEEALKLLEVKRVFGFCEDYRQSGDVANYFSIDPENDAAFVSAGGAAQPDKERFDVDVDFYVAILDNNPEAEIILGIHDEVCGGANKTTDGKMAEIRSNEGKQAETSVMEGYGIQMFEAIKRRKPSAKVSLYSISVNESNKFSGISKIR